MIPAQAVEAALAAHLTFKNQRGMDNAENLMRHILEAAAPHMLAGAWNEAYEKGCDRGEWEASPVRAEPKYTNPYRTTP